MRTARCLVSYPAFYDAVGQKFHPSYEASCRHSVRLHCHGVATRRRRLFHTRWPHSDRVFPAGPHCKPVVFHGTTALVLDYTLVRPRRWAVVGSTASCGRMEDFASSDFGHFASKVYLPTTYAENELVWPGLNHLASMGWQGWFHSTRVRSNPRPAGVWIVTRPAGGGGAKAHLRSP